MYWVIIGIHDTRIIQCYHSVENISSNSNGHPRDSLVPGGHGSQVHHWPYCQWSYLCVWVWHLHQVKKAEFTRSVVTHTHTLPWKGKYVVWVVVCLLSRVHILYMYHAYTIIIRTVCAYGYCKHHVMYIQGSPGVVISLLKSLCVCVHIQTISTVGDFAQELECSGCDTPQLSSLPHLRWSEGQATTIH